MKRLFLIIINLWTKFVTLQNLHPLNNQVDIINDIFSTEHKLEKALIKIHLLILIILINLQYVYPQTVNDKLWITNGPVHVVVTYGNKIYIGGTFTNVRSANSSDMQTRYNIAAFDITTGEATPWNPMIDGTVYAIAISGSTVYVGGDFNLVNTDINLNSGLERNKLAAFDITTGEATSWNPNVEGEVRAILIIGSTVYAGGQFNWVGADSNGLGGVERLNLAAFDKITGNVTSWNPRVCGECVFTLATSGSTIYAGGDFFAVNGTGDDCDGGQNRLNLAAFNITTGSATSWNPRVCGGFVYTLATSGSTIYAGGNFLAVNGTGDDCYGGQDRFGIAAFDAFTGDATIWNPGIEGEVYAIAIGDSTIYVGGTFEQVGVDSIQERHNIAEFDATIGLPTRWNPNANNMVYSLTFSDSIVYVGGDFGIIAGSYRPYFAGVYTSISPPASTSIYGRVYSDFTGECDTTNPGLSEWIIKLMGGNSIFPKYAVTGPDGEYGFNNLSPGYYTITAQEKDGFEQTCPLDGRYHIFLDSSQTIGGFNFGVQELPNYQDLEVHVGAYFWYLEPCLPQKRWFPAWISVDNNGTDDVYPTTLDIYIDGGAIYSWWIWGGGTGLPLDASKISISLGELNSKEGRKINLTYTTFIPPTQPIGLYAVIKPVEGDRNPTNNVDYHYVFTGVGHNIRVPMDMAIYPVNNVTKSDKLTYYIGFQNIGSSLKNNASLTSTSNIRNSPVVNVTVVDTLPPELDLSTLNVEMCSHPYNFQVEGNGVLKWNFNNIMLPDTATDRLNSSGLIKFSIKPIENITPGTVISNYATIFFDDEPGITTDTVTNTIVSEVGIIVDASHRWNLMSVPVKSTRVKKEELFPTAISQAFIYNGNYLKADTLLPGNGFWLKFDNNTSISLTGDRIMGNIIGIEQGWNLIGSISVPLPVYSIMADSADVTLSEFFGYAGSYFRTNTLQPGKGYWVKANKKCNLIITTGGTSTFSKNVVTFVPTSEMPPQPPEGEATPTQKQIPTEFALEQNHPNPFNPVTVIKYQIPDICHVSLKVFDILGREVAVLVNEVQNAGYKSVEWDASKFPTGVYMYRLNAGAFTDVKKLLLVK